MEINQIEAFLAVAEVNGFSRAATVLHLSQPAISRRINLLEQELGVTLFERIHAGIALTQAGQTFLPYAQRVLAAIRDGIEAVQSIEAQEQGTVNLAIVGTLASTRLTARLLAFRDSYPHVQLRLRTARSIEVSQMVRSGDVQLGLRYFPDAGPELVSQIIDHERLVVVCAARSHLTNLETVTIDDLRKCPIVTFPLGKGASGEPFAQHVFRQLHQHDLDLTEIVAIDSLTAQKRLIEADFGIGLLPISSIQEECNLGTLHILDVEPLRTAIPVVLLYRREGYLSKAARTLIDALTTPAEKE